MSNKPAGQVATTEGFRDYEVATDGVKLLYAENHRKQTLDYVLAQKAKHLDNGQYSVWQVFDMLDSLVDQVHHGTVFDAVERS